MITKKLQEITLNITDGKHGDCEGEDNSGYFFISCKDVYDGAIHYDGARQITEKDFIDTHRRTMLEPNDILVTNSGTIGRMALVKENDYTYRTTFQKSVAIVKPNQEMVRPAYLYYCLLNCVTQFVNQSNGSAQKNLLLGTMRNFEIRYEEDFSKQDKVIDVLQSYDNLIENNQKQIKLLEEAAQRLYKEWFVDLRFPGYEDALIVDGVPEGWSRAKVTDFLEIKYGKDHKKLEEGIIPVYGSGGIMRKVKPVLYSGESVLIPRKGSLNNIMYVEGDFWTIDTMFYSIPKQKNAAKYVYLFLKGLDMYSYNIGAAVPSMTVKILDGIELLAPTDIILEKFENVLFPIYNRINVLTALCEGAGQARDRLLPKLMSGELEV